MQHILSPTHIPLQGKKLERETRWKLWIKQSKGQLQMQEQIRQKMDGA